MTNRLNRRTFLEGTAAAGLALGALPSARSYARTYGANDKIVVAVMGVNGRGSALARGFAQQTDTEVACVIDVDSRALAKGIAAVKGYQPDEPQTAVDVRKVLEDKAIDVLAIGAPNHWHAPATIMGCQAGKHVYVEKPCSHTAREGELAVSAAREHERVVTMGTQRRSRELLIKAITMIHEGRLGKVLYSRSWYNNRRGPIGVGEATDAPSWLDFELWQGPTTDQQYRSNLVHYNWHWHWHWGNGELGNNGVHALDMQRWGMQVDYPTRVTSGGGRYRFEDDQQTADTHVATFEFGDKMMIWEGLSWSPLGPGGSRFGVTFHGDEASMHVFDTGYKIYDMQNNLVEEESGSGGDAEHFVDFLGCIRNGGRPNADIEEGHKSTLLCHLGNIALRTGDSLRTDATNGHILENSAAAAMWSKEYRDGWELE